MRETDGLKAIHGAISAVPRAMAGPMPYVDSKRWKTFPEGYSLPGPRQQAVAGAGQDRFDALLTRRAGVHVDFHAHRHFHNLRSFPTHQGPPKECVGTMPVPDQN